MTNYTQSGYPKGLGMLSIPSQDSRASLDFRFLFSLIKSHDVRFLFTFCNNNDIFSLVNYVLGWYSYFLEETIPVC